MPLLTLLLIVFAVGVLVWLVNTYSPLTPQWKNIFNIVAILGVVLLICSLFGLFDAVRGVRVGR